MIRRWLRLTVCIGAAVPLAGCDGDRINDNPCSFGACAGDTDTGTGDMDAVDPSCGAELCPVQPSQDDARPDIQRVSLLQQLPGDPFALVFRIDFADANADLDNLEVGLLNVGIPPPAGTVHLEDMSALLLRSGLPADATSGSVALPLRFAARSGPRQVHLTFQLQDTAGRYSNCYSLNLTLSPRDL